LSFIIIIIIDYYTALYKQNIRLRSRGIRPVFPSREICEDSNRHSKQRPTAVHQHIKCNSVTRWFSAGCPQTKGFLKRRPCGGSTSSQQNIETNGKNRSKNTANG